MLVDQFSEKINAEIIINFLNDPNSNKAPSIVDADLFHDQGKNAIVKIPNQKIQIVEFDINTLIKTVYLRQNHYFTFVGDVINVHFPDNNTSMFLIKSHTPIIQKQKREYFRLQYFADFKAVEYKPYYNPTKLDYLSKMSIHNSFQQYSIVSFNNGLLLDISGSGMKIQVGQRMEVGMQMLLKIPLSSMILETIASVMWVCKSPNGVTYDVALQFTDIADTDRDKIVNFIFTEQAKKRKVRMI